MESTRYLIVGGGMTGDAAVKGIRERDADGSIVLVSAEQHPPYARPPLTKGLWSGADEGKIWRGTEDAGADLRLGRRIVSLDLDGRRATDDAGDEYAWEKLLLATGGRPRTIPGTDGVVYYRTLDDYRAVRARVHEGARAVVIGGGFIGSEMAASLTANGCLVTMVFPEAGITSRVLPAELSAYVTEDYRRRGVEVLTEETVEAAGAGSVTTGSGRTIEADIVIAGLGLEPRHRSGEGGRPRGRQRDRRRRVGPCRGARRRFRRRRRCELPGRGARAALPGRARRPREVTRSCGRREHGGSQYRVRPSAVLLLRHV